MQSAELLSAQDLPSPRHRLSNGSRGVLRHRMCRRVLLLQYLMSSWSCSQDSPGKYPLVAISISRLSHSPSPSFWPLAFSAPFRIHFLAKATMHMQTTLSWVDWCLCCTYGGIHYQNKGHGQGDFTRTNHFVLDAYIKQFARIENYSFTTQTSNSPVHLN